MIALIQRVSRASVSVAGEVTGEIGPGLLVLLGVEREDDEQKANRLCERVLGYRIFSDADGKMNLNVQQAGGSVLVVSQFTLAADTERGMRPGFSRGAAPEKARRSITTLLHTAASKSPRKPGASLPICRCRWSMTVPLHSGYRYEPACGAAPGHKRECSYVSSSRTAN